MKEERKEELMVRGMDGELSSAEMEELKPILESDPVLREMFDRHRTVRDELQNAFGGTELPYGDFFQTKLARAIERDAVADAPKTSRKTAWRDALRWWLAPLAVGAMALAFLAGTKVTHEPETTVAMEATVNSVVYTPEGGVSANYLSERGSGTSVILIDGLEPIPDSYDLMAGSETGSAVSEGFQLISAPRERQIF